MTAVEWLEEQIIDIDYPIGEMIKIFKQAKEMEKQQIINAFKEGADDGCDEMLDGNEEQYYTSTYGSKGSDVISSQTEISDEEIEKAANENSINYKQRYMSARSFIDGAKWYREQLRKIGASQEK